MNNPRHAGFSMLEIILALTLSMGMVLMISQAYLSLKQAYAMQHAMIDIQQNARIALLSLARSVRIAGLNTCHANMQINHTALHLQDTYLQSYLARNNKKNSDVLSIEFSRQYRGHCQAIPTVYFIADTGRNTSQGKPVYGLYEKIGHSPRGELVSNAIAMRVHYIEWLPNEHSWLAHGASSVINWQHVKAVAIELLFRSNNPIVAPHTYWFNGAWHQPLNKYWHQGWTLYAVIRE